MCTKFPLSINSQIDNNNIIRKRNHVPAYKLYNLTSKVFNQKYRNPSIKSYDHVIKIIIIILRHREYMYTKVQVKGLPSYAIWRRRRKKKRTAHIDVYLNERNLILMMIKDKCTSHITLAMFKITRKIEIELTFVIFRSCLVQVFRKQ